MVLVPREHAAELVEILDLVGQRGVLGADGERGGRLPDLGVARVDLDLIVRAGVVAVEHEMIGVVVGQQIRRHARIVRIVVDQTHQVLAASSRPSS